MEIKEGGDDGNTEMHEVTEILIVVQGIANHKLVWNFKSYIIRNIAGAKWSSLPEQTGNFNTLGLVLDDSVEQFLHGPAGVNDILNNQDILPSQAVKVIQTNYIYFS